MDTTAGSDTAKPTSVNLALSRMNMTLSGFMYVPLDDVMFVQVRDSKRDVDTSVQPPHQLKPPRHGGAARFRTVV